MEDKIFIEILTKAKQLGVFSYGSLGNTTIKKDEFLSTCASLCEINVLQKIQKPPVYATGGQRNQRLIAFDEEIEYRLLISKEECAMLIDECKKGI